ncbi:hypothetical protein RVIR1_05310 [Candidatus Rickettsiella viridis]|uniref:Uncharacterized protein n=1 Tax=Candidatus Rickettsiella viridis TaxID=676208 RepID=A0A2Z5UTT7_9COXI|nr:hypothetical protein RVIR1_05310 [Candidatus Rickettsiella viridis]
MVGQADLQLLIHLHVLQGAAQGVSQIGEFSGILRAPVAQPERIIAAAAAAITRPVFFMIMIIYPL